MAFLAIVSLLGRFHSSKVRQSRWLFDPPVSWEPLASRQSWDSTSKNNEKTTNVVKTIINHHHHHHHHHRHHGSFNFCFNLWKIPSRVSSTLLAGQLRPRLLDPFVGNGQGGTALILHLGESRTTGMVLGKYSPESPIWEWVKTL